jgi:hypothetical protein
MAEITEKSAQKIMISDILGLWEVLRVEMDENTLYPWIRGRFMFDFLENEVFACIKEGKHSNGTWELVEKTLEYEKQFSILLNETSRYRILHIDQDEMIISDRNSKYLLARKL